MEVVRSGVKKEKNEIDTQGLLKKAGYGDGMGAIWIEALLC
jgi:hypothetical protein